MVLEVLQLSHLTLPPEQRRRVLQLHWTLQQVSSYPLGRNLDVLIRPAETCDFGDLCTEDWDEGSFIFQICGEDDHQGDCLASSVSDRCG